MLFLIRRILVASCYMKTLYGICGMSRGHSEAQKKFCPSRGSLWKGAARNVVDFASVKNGGAYEFMVDPFVLNQMWLSVNAACFEKFWDVRRCCCAYVGNFRWCFVVPIFIVNITQRICTWCCKFRLKVGVLPFSENNCRLSSNKAEHVNVLVP